MRFCMIAKSEEHNGTADCVKTSCRGHKGRGHKGTVHLCCALSMYMLYYI